MNNIQVFNFQKQPVRTVLINNEPHFVAKDVCEYFGDTNYRRSVARLDDDISRLRIPAARPPHRPHVA